MNELKIWIKESFSAKTNNICLKFKQLCESLLGFCKKIYKVKINISNTFRTEKFEIILIIAVQNFTLYIFKLELLL